MQVEAEGKGAKHELLTPKMHLTSACWKTFEACHEVCRLEGAPSRRQRGEQTLPSYSLQVALLMLYLFNQTETASTGGEGEGQGETQGKMSENAIFSSSSALLLVPCPMPPAQQRL
jgi:hypothetical protein